MASFRFRGQFIALLTAMPAWLAIHTAFSSPPLPPGLWESGG